MKNNSFQTGAVDFIVIFASLILGMLALFAFFFTSQGNKKGEKIIITNEHVNNSTEPATIATSSSQIPSSIIEYNFLRKQLRKIRTRLNGIVTMLEGNTNAVIVVSSVSVLSGSLDLSSIPFGFSFTHGAYSIKMGTDAEPYFLSMLETILLLVFIRYYYHSSFRWRFVCR